MTIELGASVQHDDTGFEELDEKTPETETEPIAEEPAPLVAVLEAKRKIRELKAKQTKALTDLNVLREKLELSLAKAMKRLSDAETNLNVAYRDLGQAVSANDEPTPTEAAPKPPTDTNWRNAPIGMLKLPAGAEKALIEQNEITTLGQLADYVETNNTLIGLEGVTDKRAEKIQEKLNTFIDSQA